MKKRKDIYLEKEILKKALKKCIEKEISFSKYIEDLMKKDLNLDNTL